MIFATLTLLTKCMLMPPLLQEGCLILAQRVRGMTTSALAVVAGVVGAASAQEFAAAASSMTPSSLAHLRDEISNMGLGHKHAPTL